MKSFLWTVLFLFPLLLVAGEKPFARITLRTNTTLPAGTPVAVSLERMPEYVRHASLILVMDGEYQNFVVACQVETHPVSRLWWLLPEKVPAGSVRIFELKTGRTDKWPFMEIRMDSSGLEVGRGTAKALRYNYGVIPPPDSSSELYFRSGFIHPIWTPHGTVLTRIHPSDHIHHMGFWNPWTKAIFEGQQVDFWNLGEGEGTVRFVRFLDVQIGPVFGSFQVLHDHVVFKQNGREKVALKEIWHVKVWNLNQIPGKIWIWDFTTAQWCATDKPLRILKYRYGGFGFRGTAEWNEKNSAYLTSEGKTRVDGNGTRARWCMISGQTNNGVAGIAFFSHPENHEHPEPMRIWPRGDVFFGFCPVVYADWELKPGKNYIRKYRVVVFDGKMSAQEVETLWQAFAHPPNMQIEWLK